MAVALLLTLVSFIGNITSLVQGRLPTLLWFTAPVLVAGVTWLISRYQAVTQNSAELDPENRVGNQVHSLDGAVDTIVSL